MRILDLFSGIGGFSLAATWVWGDELEIHSFVEIDPFCQKVLRKHWPNVPIHDDIRSYKHDWTTIDLICGGPPCQPASVAGKRKGKADDRWLWPETIRIVSEVKPNWCIFENPTGILSLEQGVVFENLLAQMEAQGYEVWPVIIPACAVGAPHRRDRIWIIAHSTKQGLSEPGLAGVGELQTETTEGIHSRFKQQDSYAPDTDRFNDNNAGFGAGKVSQQQETKIFGMHDVPQRNRAWDEPWPEVAARLCRVDDGLPRQMDRTNRLKALGNAIVPQCVAPIMRAIKAVL